MSKKDTPFIPPMPYFEPPSQETIEKLQNMTKKERKALSKDPKIKKYTDRLKEREKQFKREARCDWWKNNWIALLSLVFAFIAAVPVIIYGIETILRWLGL